MKQPVGSKSLSLREKFNYSVNRENLGSIKSNRMRTIIQIINREYGKEALAIFRKWGNFNMKMCDYEDHRRFLLRCLGNGIIPVSIRLKNHVRTQRSDNIIHKAERSLLNKRIREVNITLDWLKHDTYMYQTKLSAVISEDLMKQSIEFTKDHRQSRHKTVMERQIKKYNKLWAQKYESGSNSTYSGNGTGGCSNQDKIGAKCWFVNLSINPYLKHKKLFWHTDPILQSLLRPPFKEYITAVEVACQSLKPSEADEFRADIARILKQARPSKSNISKEEWKAIKELRADKDQLVLTADKGVALVVIDKKDYIQKMNQLLEDKNTYRLLKMDPTNKQKNRLINILRRIQSEGRLEEYTYKKMYQTGASSPKLYGLPKIHKKDIPLRPMVSSQGSVSYGVAKELARILKPLSGNNNHQVLNSKEFADDIKKMKLKEGECIISYDVAALFTSIPVKPAIEVVKKKLEQDTELHQRTTMSTQIILDLLGVLLMQHLFPVPGPIL